MNKQQDIGFEAAYRLTMENTTALDAEVLPVAGAVGRVAADDVAARVDSPSVDCSMKDGYAVLAEDVAEASPDKPVYLDVSGYLAAGSQPDCRLHPGQAIRILSGAPIPPGADAVLAEEFTERQDQAIVARAHAGPGRNILEKGVDVHRGENLLTRGQVIYPQYAGLMVAGGIAEVAVYRRPKVGLLATGSEIMLPGEDFKQGKLYASNVALQHAWLNAVGFEVQLKISGDSKADIAAAVEALFAEVDVVITSGGAWKGDRDLVVGVLEYLGWEMIFHRVRMGPGKAAGMGLLNKRPVFVLPGGPASNETSFLMIVFPAILKMAGFSRCPYLKLYGRLTRTITGQSNWTQFIQCDLEQREGEIVLFPKKLKSRLAAMAKTPAVVMIPEGVDAIAADTMVPFMCVDRDRFMHPI